MSRNRILITILSGFLVALIPAATAGATFNQNDVIDDVIFDNSTSMNARNVDDFLNTFAGSCISTNSGFTASDITGYTPAQGFTYGSPVSAGKVITHAAQAYGLNPQVLVVTLQKEEGVVDGSGPYGCTDTALASAVGYGCTDSGTSTHNYSYPSGGLLTPLYYRNGTPSNSISNSCVNSGPKAGFSEQIIHAAWLLKFGEQRSQGRMNWAVIMKTTTDLDGSSWTSNWDNSDDPQSCYSGPMTQGTWQVCPSGGTATYDGYTTIDGVAVHMDSGATAAMYWYTPHFHGNQVFQSVFNQWFGTTVTAGFSWQFVNQFAYTDASMTNLQNTYQLVAGQRYFLTVRVKNIGTQTWTKNQVFLGTYNPQDRSSAFKDWTWPSPRNNRAGTLVQDTVAPGEYGDFQFWIHTPLATGYYYECFNLLDEGITWMGTNNICFQLQSNPVTYSWQYTGQYAWTDATKTALQNTFQLVHGQRYLMTVTAKNTGNMPWYRGQVNLATWAPQDHASPVKDWTWPSTQNNRPGYFNEDVVQPGQTATYDFWVLAPSAPGTYWERYNLVVEGVAWMSDQNLYFGYGSN